jgi:hypothetical protein
MKIIFRKRNSAPKASNQKLKLKRKKMPNKKTATLLKQKSPPRHQHRKTSKIKTFQTRKRHRK